MRVKTVQIDADVEAVLKAAKLDGNNLYLQGQLDRKMYEKVNKVLSLIGFKWTSGKVKAHVGQGDSMDKLKEALGSGKVVDEKQTFQFFGTPARLAGRMASLANIKPGDRVLEPSAGEGTIIEAIKGECSKLAVIFAIEVNPKMAMKLAAQDAEAAEFAKREGGYQQVIVTCGDFLNSTEMYDKIVMNPPFTGGQDISHVRHAYDLLLPGGRLVAIMSSSWLTNSARKFCEFREWYVGIRDAGQASYPEMIEAGTFKESGTNVQTVLVIMDKPLAKEKAA